MTDSGTRRLMRTPSLVVSLFLLAFVSCENNPLDAIDTTGSAPVLKSASIIPASLDIDVTPPGASRQVSVTVTAYVSDPQGASDVSSVTYTVFGPPGDSLITSGRLVMIQPAADSLPVTCTGAPAFAVDTITGGIYRLEIQATDKAGHLSAGLLREVTVFRGKSAPVLSLPGARWLAQSGTDSIFYAVSITAFDANGLKDIARVSVRAAGARNSTALAMYDDGLKTHGDAVAGDGVFSVRTWVAPVADIHDVVFEFDATDNAGHASNTARRPVVNAPPMFTFLNVPSTIQRPASGASLVSFFVGVTDGDGSTDIDSVFFKNMSSSTPTAILMYDDGDTVIHGDTLAGDGTYSRILSIDASTSTGTKQFKFTVTDRLGARTDSTKSITIN
jgi:hypothetical protein